MNNHSHITNLSNTATMDQAVFKGMKIISLIAVSISGLFSVNVYAEINNTYMTETNNADYITEVVNTPPQTTDFIHPDIAHTYCSDNQFSKQEILNYINEVRTKGLTCEGKVFLPVQAITWNDKLAQASRRHSIDMSKTLLVDHKGSDGSMPDQRVDQAGYYWYDLAENVASGTRSLAATLDAFIMSEYHCKNVMHPKVKEMGMACAFNPNSDQAMYWTQVFATKD